MHSNHRTTVLVAAFLVAFLCALLQGCGLIYIGGLSPGYTKDDLLANSEFHWIKDSSASSDIYFEPDSWAARHVLLVRSDADSALVRTLSLIGERSFQPRLNYFIVNNRSRMRSLIGRETNGSAFVRERVICAVANDSVKALGAHEVFHAVAMDLWGSTADWVNEGMAVYSDDQWWMQELHPLAHYLELRQRLPSLEQLTKEFRRGKDLLTYPAAGSFVKFLYETFGLREIEVLWKQGFAAFCKSVHMTESDLEQEWLNKIAEFNTDNIHYAIPE